jgi:four helix bundle protein
MAERFEELDVWQRSRELANLIYDVSEVGSFARDFGLRDQMRRSAVSVMSNIAEGFESRTQALFIEFLGRTKGSAGEIRAQLYVAVDRKYISPDQFNTALRLTEACSRQTARLIQYLETQLNTRRIKEETLTYNLETRDFEP